MAGWRTRRPLRRGWEWSAGRLIVVVIALALFALLVHVVHVLHWDKEPPKVLRGVPSIVDGDTISFSGSQVRLEGIDAPEFDQSCADAGGKSWACGRMARDHLRAHIGGREVTCRRVDFDIYDRMLGICLLRDGSDVNAWMVRQGWAVAYGIPRRYAAQEAEAKAAKRGIWGGAFTRPSEWREKEREEQTP
jgi:endonuclease YncB( thermonuclease family)